MPSSDRTSNEPPDRDGNQIESDDLLAAMLADDLTRCPTDQVAPFLLFLGNLLPHWK